MRIFLQNLVSRVQRGCRAGSQDSMDIQRTINKLYMILDVTPDYSYGRRRGIPDNEIEEMARESVCDAITLLENMLSDTEIRDMNFEDDWRTIEYN